MTAIPDVWVEAFAEGWASVTAAQPGDRRRAGLAAVLPFIVEAIAESIEDEQHRDCTDYDCYDAEMHAGLGAAADLVRRWIP